MKSKRTLAVVILVALGVLVMFATFRGARAVKAERAATKSPASNAPKDNDDCPDPWIVCYSVKPSDTDGPNNDGSDGCFGIGIGCDEPENSDSGELQGNFWGDLAINKEHFLYLPYSTPDTGKLLLILCGGDGKAKFCENLFPVATRQGYHVIGLTYPTGFDACDGNFSCFGDLMLENVTGENESEESRISKHPQDSVVNRLIKVLEWAHANHKLDGWDRYLTGPPGMHDVDWRQVHLAGHSNGSSYASRMGTLYPDIGRVALFSGPNDGRGDSAADWNSASYIQLVEGITDTRYFGLVHFLNKADSDTDDVLYKVAENWHKFGMEGPLNRPRFEFFPDQNQTPAYFDGAHMLISKNSTTNHVEAHNSIVKDYECSVIGDDPGDNNNPPKQICLLYENEVDAGAPKIGYEPAWRCILGTGLAANSSPPTANAGPDSKAKCQGFGGGTVVLDGSRSRDPECDVLNYVWHTPFGRVTGRNPTVFLPLGTSTITLVVSDPWSSSPPDTVSVVMRDTTPPVLQVTVTPTELTPANHQMVRIHATINSLDACQDGPVHIVLTSIKSSEPDSGFGPGDLAGDIQGANFGTFDQNFTLRAESFGNGRRGRTYTITYTATDPSGNSRQTSATVLVRDPKGKL